MKTERLEELAAKCAVAIDGVGRNASYGLSDSDLHDLARCALAWAKLEILLASSSGQLTLSAHNARTMKWGLTPDHHYRKGRSGHTAIEAVEAAEVG